MRVTVYVHGDKDAQLETGEQIGLKGEALQMFRHACDELELELEVDTLTGITKLISVDGKELKNA